MAPTTPSTVFTVNMISVESSNIESVGWQRNQLFVRFHNGGEYKYSNVPESLFHDMLAADSKGKFLHEHVKGKFPYVKVRIQDAND